MTMRRPPRRGPLRPEPSLTHPHPCPDADDAARAYVGDAYGHDPALAERRLRRVPTTPAAIRALMARSAGMGMDEVVLRPCGAGLDQLDRLAQLV